MSTGPGSLTVPRTHSLWSLAAGVALPGVGDRCHSCRDPSPSAQLIQGEAKVTPGPGLGLLITVEFLPLALTAQRSCHQCPRKEWPFIRMLVPPVSFFLWKCPESVDEFCLCPWEATEALRVGHSGKSGPQARPVLPWTGCPQESPVHPVDRR